MVEKRSNESKKYAKKGIEKLLKGEKVDFPPPPSCKSFKFENVTTDWQAATISEFKMKVRVGTLTNYQRYSISIPLLTFETWSEDRFGNTLTSGAAAEIAAEAIQKAA